MEEKDYELVIVEENDELLRLDKYLAQSFSDISRSRFQKMIEDKKVLVNGIVPKSKYIVKPADEIYITNEPPKEIELIPEDIPLDIIYEDSDVIIVNKPKQMVVHPAPGHESGTLVNALMYHCKDLSGINGEIRPGIVHRIDMNTTGSLIVCKNDKAHNIIAEQIKVHSVNRIYYGIVHGVIKEDNGIIDAAIGRSVKDRKKMAIDKQHGRNAITHYTVLKRSDKYSLVEFKLETGRTHQIRVHMASIGHPLLGDDVYGPDKCPVKGLIGQTLHAKIIGFNHPSTSEYVEFSAPLPDYFNKLITDLFE